MQPQSTSDNANSITLGPREWLVAAAIVLAAVIVVPRMGGGEFASGDPDYRIPYALSEDYWLYDARNRAVGWRGRTPVVGDSVIWGHYVPPEATLSHYLSGGDGEFLNCGVDGIHPLAMAGLIRHYAAGLTRIEGQPIILHCNPLWLAGEAEHLHDPKNDFRLNHERLIPQLWPKVATYKEPLSDRIDVAVERWLPFRSVARHVQWTTCGGLDLPNWAMEHPYGASPPRPDDSPVERKTQLDTRTWRQRGMTPQELSFIGLDESLHWWGFLETVEILRGRGARVFVIIGPLNEHMLSEASRAEYAAMRKAMAERLTADGVECFVPPVLPSAEYADLSHPLAAGYRRLAEMIRAGDAFQRFERGEDSQ